LSFFLHEDKVVCTVIPTSIAPSNALESFICLSFIVRQKSLAASCCAHIQKTENVSRFFGCSSKNHTNFCNYVAMAILNYFCIQPIFTMSLEIKVNDQIKEAMKAKDEAGLRTLRAIKAAILIEKTAEGAKDQLSEADEVKMLQKMAKQRRDSLDIFTAQNREDLAAKEREELAILERFLPKQMSGEELEAELKQIIEQVGAKSPTDMGKVMGAATKALAGKADGKAISETVKKLLAN
jgi:uncharacterized protein YqeY